MATSKPLQILALKLGLANEGKVLSKAAEFERLLQIKSTTGNNLSDTSKVVILLDLAASLIGAEFDQKIALKYSGLKGPGYKNSRKVIENLLELNNDKLSISTLCLSLQCTAVQDLAESILKEYEKTSKVEVDLTLPQYVCMAIYQACRINKIKIKTKIIEKSRLKADQWNKLEAEWKKIVDEKFLVAKKRGRQPKVVVENDNEMDIDPCPVETETSETIIEPYEDWKQRILEQAHKEVKELEMPKKSPRKRLSIHDENLPRRSPRKTPQKSASKHKMSLKFSPFKSPEKPPRLRLDFPEM